MNEQEAKRLLSGLDHNARWVFLRLTSPKAATVYRYIRRNHGATVRDVSDEHSGISPRSAATYIQRLHARGLLQRVDKSNNPKEPRTWAVTTIQ